MHKLALVSCVLLMGCTYSAGNRGGEIRQELQAKMGQSSADLAAARADKTAGRTGVTASATVTYWLGLKEALHPRPINPEVAARTIDHQPTLGVDPELVKQGQIVVEKMRAASESIKSVSGFVILFRFPSSSVMKAEALSKAAVEQCRVVERMRPDLTARYGMEFPPLDLPTP